MGHPWEKNSIVLGPFMAEPLIFLGKNWLTLF